MEYLHVINIDKHNPNYKDRQNIWLRFHFSAMNDHGFDRLCEIDKWRFINFIRLQIQTKKAVSLDLKYLNRQGFDFTARRLTSTINQLKESKLVTIRTGTEQEQVGNESGTGREQVGNSEGTEQEQKPKTVEPKGLTTKSVTQSRVEKSKVDVYKRVFNYWNTLSIKQHRDFKKFKPSISSSLENYSEQEIISAMENYKVVVHGSEYFFSYRWSLSDFLSRKNGLDTFMNINKPLQNFRSKDNNFARTPRNENPDGSIKVAL